MSATIARINPRRPFSVTAEGLKRIVLGEAGQGGAVHFATHRADAPKPLRPVGEPKAHILVIAHSTRSSLDAQAHQAIAAAALLADPSTAVTVLVLGELTEDLSPLGADQVLVAAACERTLFQPDRDLAVAADLIARLDPRHIILPDNACGTGDLGRRLAARLGAATATHVVELRPDAVATYRRGGAQMARRDLPRLILLDADTTDIALPFRGAGALTQIDTPAPTTSPYADRGTPPVDAALLGLEEADFIVAAGNGVTDVPTVQSLARTFDAAIGASRVAVDDGRFRRDQQVGATGKTVSASVYLALGISGAVQHLQGIKAVRHVIAINTDAGAPIAGRADLTLVDDAQAVMTELLAATRGRNFADDAGAMPPETPAGPTSVRGEVRRGSASTPDPNGPRVLVLASLGRNPVNGAARPNRDDLLALEMARGLGETTMLHAGNPDEAALGDYLAYGATTIDVVPAVPGQDIAESLVAQAAGYDLILTGTRAEGGEGSGLVPYLVAERLGWSVVSQAIAVTVRDGHADITQALPKGQRRHVRVRLPAVIAVDPRAPVTPFYAFARRMAGQVVRREPTAVMALDTAWHLEPAKRPVKFKAKDQKTGHARMLSAIVAETRGGAVIATGSPADKAQAILSYLRTHKLIDW